MIIRMLDEHDDEAFLQLRKQVNEETSFMLRESDENALLAEQHLKQIRSNAAQENLIIFVAEEQGQLVGFLVGERGGRQRNRHRLSLMIGILQVFTGKGVGTHLFEVMEDWARKKGIFRLELTVMTTNQAAVALYRKVGFEIEGTMRQTLLVDGEYIDEYVMSKFIA